MANWNFTHFLTQFINHQRQIKHEYKKDKINMLTKVLNLHCHWTGKRPYFTCSTIWIFSSCLTPRFKNVNSSNHMNIKKRGVVFKISNNYHTSWYQEVNGWLLEFYTLATSKFISGWTPTCNSAHSWWLYSAAPGRQHHGLISHSVTLSWYWANQSLHYSNNAERLARNHYKDIMGVHCRQSVPVLIWP